MLVQLRHPVTASGSPKNGKSRKTICGMTTTPYEIAEIDAGDMLPAVEIERVGMIHTFDGKCWRASHAVGWVEGQELDPSTVDCQADIESFRQRHEREFSDMVRRHGWRSLSPSMRENELTFTADYFRRAGAFEDRISDDVESLDIRASREDATRYMDNFVICGRKVFQRCHEPVLVAYPGAVALSSTAMHSQFADDRERNRKGWSEVDYPGHIAQAHAFPFDALPQARDMAERLRSQRVEWQPTDASLPAMTVHLGVSSSERLADLEAVRFLKLHDNMARAARSKVENDKFLQGVLKGRGGKPNYTAPDIAAYLLATRNTAVLVSAYEYDRGHVPGIGELKQHLEDIVALARDRDVRAFALSDRQAWDTLMLNSEILIERFDDAPIDVAGVDVSVHPR